MRGILVVLSIVWLAAYGCATATKAVDVPIPPPPAPVRVMVEALASPDPTVRARSAWQLAGARESQAEASAALASLRGDPDKAVRYAAAWALGHLPGDSKLAAAKGTLPPKAVHISRPNYPQEAFVAKVEGTVLIDLLIGEEGEVAHAAIHSSIPRLDEAALACVRQWRFEPGQTDGKPIATMAQAPITFRIY